MEEISNKRARLKEFFKDNPKCALAFSGGVDSAYLLYAAAKFGAKVQPYYFKTAFQPQFEYADALKLCAKLGSELKTVEYDILSDNTIASNPENRCYFCKKAMFGCLKSRAKTDGYDVIIDGTNASDNYADRPGMKALAELSVLSPLRECGLTKDEIRALSKSGGLFTWDKPAYACLATRIYCGEKITADILERVEAAESELKKMGFTDMRVRVIGCAAKIQIKSNQLAAAENKKDEILKRLKPYFDTIVPNLEER